MTLEKDKPEITKHLVITAITKKAKETPYFLDEGDEYKTIVIPLTNFGFIEYEKESTLYIRSKIKLPKKIDRLALTITTDPKIEHAGDWSDLGQFRFVVKILKPKLSYDGEKTLLTFKKINFQQDLWMPDRVKWTEKL